MHNRLFYLFLFVIVFTSSCLSQQVNDTSFNQSEIVGVWQVNSNQVSSALLANFQFFKSGKFIYNINSYDDLNPIYNISGTFKLGKNILYLKIEQFKQLTGFKVVESSTGFQSGSFVLDGGKITVIKQNDSTFSEHELNIIKNEKGDLKFILIDGEKYFKLSNNPVKFNR